MEQDQVVGVLPIRYSNALAPNIQIHQFPLLTRPLQTPPSAVSSGKRIHARIKPNARRLEVHVPADTRPDVWNSEKSKALGVAQADDDLEKNQESLKGKQKEGQEPRLAEVRMRSEQIPQKGVHMLGIVRGGNFIPFPGHEFISLNNQESLTARVGQLHLHPIAETHQLRPTLTYLDVLSSRKTKRFRAGAGSESESDDGPPPDPDEPAPIPTPKKDKKPAGEAKEVQVSARKSDEKGGQQPLQGGLSSVRRDMLSIIRTEEEENWQDLEFCDGEVRLF